MDFLLFPVQMGQVRGDLKGPTSVSHNTKHSCQGEHVDQITLFRKVYDIIILLNWSTQQEHKNESNVLSDMSSPWNVLKTITKYSTKDPITSGNLIHDGRKPLPFIYYYE